MQVLTDRPGRKHSNPHQSDGESTASPPPSICDPLSECGCVGARMSARDSLKLEAPCYDEGFAFITCAAHPWDVSRICSLYAQVCYAGHMPACSQTATSETLPSKAMNPDFMLACQTS